MIVFALSVVLYAFGAFAYGAVLLQWVRGGGRTEWTGHARTKGGPGDMVVDRPGGFLVLACFVWFVVNLLLSLLSLDPARQSIHLHALFIILTYTFPPLIIHCVYGAAAEKGDRARLAPWRYAVWVAYAAGFTVVAILVPGLYRWAAWPREVLQTIGGLSLGSLYVAAGIYSSLVLSRFRQPSESAQERSSRRWMHGLFALLILLFAPALLNSLGWIPIGELLGLAMRCTPLLFLFVGTYFDSRFEFFDRLIKRGLALVLSLLLLAVWMGAVLPRLEPLARNRSGALVSWSTPWIYGVALLPLVLLLPWLAGRLSTWLDSVWLGRRYTPVQAMTRFLASVGQADGRDELIRRAQSEIGLLFQAPVHIDLTPAPASPPDALLQIPIRAEPGGSGTILLGPRANGAPYFSEDIALLNSLADVLARVLENAELQERRRHQDQLARELEWQASRSELKALRAQVNPHFLFNALNAIAGWIHRDPARADKTIEQLAEVFRYTLRRSDSEWTTLEQEIDFVRAYLEVEQARFGERLQFEIDMDPGATMARIPSLMLQTLVENAVKHGVSAKRGPGKVEIRAVLDENDLRLEIADDGPGFRTRPADDPDAEGNGGYGLANTRRRLQGYFADRARLEIDRDSARGLTRVVIVLPYETATPALTSASKSTPPVEGRPEAP